MPNSRLWRLLSITLDSPIIRAIVAALALYGVWSGAFPQIAQIMGETCGLPAALCGGLLQGAIAGHLVTGDIRGILFGASSGAAFGLIGDIASGWSGAGKWMGKPLLQGLAGGLLCGLQGQSFRNGFIDTVFFSALGLIALGVLPWLITEQLL